VMIWNLALPSQPSGFVQGLGSKGRLMSASLFQVVSQVNSYR
jgi:hypothetical protein